MRCLEILFLLAFVFSMQTSEAYRILCFAPFQGKSHYQMFEALCTGLAKKGHQVDMIGHYPMKTPIANYRDVVDLTGTLPKIVNNFTIEYGKLLQEDVVYLIATEFGYKTCHVMGSEKFQKFIKNTPKGTYDFVITEMFGSPCSLGLGPILDAPIAVIVTNMDMANINDYMGNPMSYAFWSGSNNPKTTIETFSDRLWNFLINYKEIQRFYYYTSDQTELMRKYLGQDLPSVRELEQNISMVLINGHHGLYGPRPITPAIIEIAGLHIEGVSEPDLTPEVQTWLDEANHGVVYFTLGSLLRIETLPKETILGLYSSFAKIAPIKVLMKCTNPTDLPPGLPKNIMTLNWVPQKRVLEHKNTRVFITHGGLMGAQEALYYGVPTIGIPVFGDQAKNVNILAHKKMGYILNVDNISEETMDAALNAVLRDPTYAESARKMSQLFRDRPMSPMDTAAFWIEYVIRNGPDSLKSSAGRMPWWKKSLIDVFAFLAACVAIVIVLLVGLVKMLVRKLCGSKAPLKKKLK